jgi:hypothetical protein
MLRTSLISALLVVVLSLVHGQAQTPGSLNVAAFLPAGYVTDGSISYQAELQKALDAAEGRTLVFPPLVYRVDETGLRLKSRLTPLLHGAIFKLDEQRTKDGHVFFGRGQVVDR